MSKPASRKAARPAKVAFEPGRMTRSASPGSAALGCTRTTSIPGSASRSDDKAGLTQGRKTGKGRFRAGQDDEIGIARQRGARLHAHNFDTRLRLPIG